eukprot:556709-Amphidinium_carterae.1
MEVTVLNLFCEAVDRITDAEALPQQTISSKFLIGIFTSHSYMPDNSPCMLRPKGFTVLLLQQRLSRMSLLQAFSSHVIGLGRSTALDEEPEERLANPTLRACSTVIRPACVALCAADIFSSCEVRVHTHTHNRVCSQAQASRAV